MTNLSSSLQLFWNLTRIQIQTQFFCWSQFITVTGPIFFFSPIFTLSPPEASLLLSLALGHYRAKPQEADSILDQNHKSKINPPRPPKHKQPWLPKPKLRNPNPLPVETHIFQTQTQIFKFKTQTNARNSIGLNLQILNPNPPSYVIDEKTSSPPNS